MENEDNMENETKKDPIKIYLIDDRLGHSLLADTYTLGLSGVIMGLGALTGYYTIILFGILVFFLTAMYAPNRRKISKTIEEARKVLDDLERRVK